MCIRDSFNGDGRSDLLWNDPGTRNASVWLSTGSVSYTHLDVYKRQTQDLVYTPVTPCRIVDTRNTAAGAIPASGSRSFVGAGVSTYAGQGGANVSCGLAQESPAALALNITVVTPAGAGYATAYAYGTAQPGTASVNYGSGDIVNNSVVTPTGAPTAAFDFTLFSYAEAHYWIDGCGNCHRPRCSPIECVNSATNSTTVNVGATANLVATATCPTGYGATAVNCESSSWDMPLVFISGNVCSAKNKGCLLYTSRCV